MFGRRRKYGSKRRFKRRFGGSRRRVGSRKVKFVRRIATRAAWKVHRKTAQLKWLNESSFVLPGSIYQAGASSQDLTTNSFGSSYYTGSSGPAIIDVTNYISQNLTQDTIIGNMLRLHTVSLKACLQCSESQSTYDQWNGRISVLRLKENQFIQGSASNSVLVNNLYLASSSGYQNWMANLWDKTKVKVLYDQCWYTHATPSSIGAQVNCHFRRVPINIDLRWKKGGLPLIFNRDFNPGAASIYSRVINPILIILQAGAVIDNGALPGTEPLPAYFLAPQSRYYMSWTDN